MKTIISTSEKSTLELAREFAQKTQNPGCICLFGDLGTGKTVFCRGFAEELGIPAKEIKSPTFPLIRKYSIGKKVLYHCDFYRIQEPDDVLSSDLEEMFQQKNAFILIEWPERIEKLLPQKRKNIHFVYNNPSTRTITFDQ
jgi:tRNA threonylcarbamoyladenosine biosynthesis protein TsaE